MSSYEARKASFSAEASEPAAKSTSGRRRATSARQAGWPHPVPDAHTGTSRGKSFPSASELANLGLYFGAAAAASTSKTTAGDACLLYPEEHIEISGWHAGDDPMQRIREVESHASFLLIMESKDAVRKMDKGTAWSISSATLLPTGKSMTDARMRTFGSSWPYDGKKGWKPTSKKVRNSSALVIVLSV